MDITYKIIEFLLIILFIELGLYEIRRLKVVYYLTEDYTESLKKDMTRSCYLTILISPFKKYTILIKIVSYIVLLLTILYPSWFLIYTCILSKGISFVFEIGKIRSNIPIVTKGYDEE